MSYDPYARTRQLCEEYSVPYNGPTEADLDDADNYGDYQYEMYAQQQLDEQWEGQCNG